MKVMVTGAYGQLGSSLSELSTQFSGLQLILTDFDSLDITDRNAVVGYLESNRPDFLVNCAAYTAVDKAETDMDAAYSLNALGPENLAIACRQIGARLIHVSTDYVFDGTNNKPYSEEDLPSPQGVYGSTKLEGEKLVMKQLPESIVIRTSWLYSSYVNYFVKTMIRLGSEKDSLNVVYDQTGTPTFAGDLSLTILKVISQSAINPDYWKSGIYHFSNLGVCSWYDFAIEIHKMAGISCKVTPVLSTEFQTLAKRPAYSVLDKSKFQATFGIDIPYWRDSLMKCIQRIQK